MSTKFETYSSLVELRPQSTFPINQPGSSLVGFWAGPDHQKEPDVFSYTKLEISRKSLSLGTNLRAVLLGENPRNVCTGEQVCHGPGCPHASSSGQDLARSSDPKLRGSWTSDKSLACLPRCLISCESPVWCENIDQTCLGRSGQPKYQLPRLPGLLLGVGLGRRGPPRDRKVQNSVQYLLGVMGHTTNGVKVRLAC